MHFINYILFYSQFSFYFILLPSIMGGDVATEKDMS